MTFFCSRISFKRISKEPISAVPILYSSLYSYIIRNKELTKQINQRNQEIITPRLRCALGNVFNISGVWLLTNLKKILLSKAPICTLLCRWRIWLKFSWVRIMNIDHNDGQFFRAMEWFFNGFDKVGPSPLNVFWGSNHWNQWFFDGFQNFEGNGQQWFWV